MKFVKPTSNQHPLSDTIPFSSNIKSPGYKRRKGVLSKK